MEAIRIIVCGDFRSSCPKNIHMQRELKDLMAAVDFNICNFEAPIHTENAKPTKKSGPSLDQSSESPAFLKENYFNVILLANNHIMDYGREGCEATIKAFDGVTVVGAGEAKDAFSVRFVNVRGKRIGLCSLVQNEFGIVESKDDNSYGAAWINSDDIPEIISNAKIQCDFLIVFPHAGVEHTSAPLPEWRRLYKHFIDWGADAVIASHPHCPQGWETYRDKPIYYSLGNFYFDELTYDDLWYKGIIVELSIGDKVEAKEHYVSFDDKTGGICFDNSGRMRECVEYSNALLKNNEKYIKYLDNICEKLYNDMRYGILRGLCGITLKMKFKYFFRLFACMLLGNSNEPYLLNVIRCESHRWAMLRALNNRQKK